MTSWGWTIICRRPNGLIDATLIQGDYVAAHNYGWTEFNIDAQTQQLHVTTWGIEPYTAEDLSANPESVIAKTPQIVSEFVVNPHLGGTPVTGNQPDGEAGTNLLGDMAEWKDTIAAMIPDAGHLNELLGIHPTYNGGDLPFL